ncbi:DUF2533 family protein [Caldalkalibacillus salinus]|uniref:DUF2533 family protein n=1 Tax=Caldalkalibacillus salinus TaxID=2803787 RepID=UPI001922AC5F|nr:DUF2533 family protein [Caldalkalibacillus salinus]
MSVHRAISAHSRRQNEALQRFLALDEERERYIQEAIDRCSRGESFTVEHINRVTREIQTLAQKEVVPHRQFVTTEMVKDAVQQKGSQR